VGNEPLIFSNLRCDKHSYLLLVKRNSLNKNSMKKDVIENSKDLGFLLSKNPLIVDPSFNVVQPFSQSH
jgi:hypothetical protein